jgi:hypothetical protein
MPFESDLAAHVSETPFASTTTTLAPSTGAPVATVIFRAVGLPAALPAPPLPPQAARNRAEKNAINLRRNFCIRNLSVFLSGLIYFLLCSGQNQ